MNIKDIRQPSDIKGLDSAGLKDIAAQIRMALLERTSHIGGHVGPNLGIVETAIALHYVFDSPVDRIVWDVSHQSYPHKILTGRVEGFIDPADYGKVSGYTNPGESPHDFFTVGHTSTSVSMASGLAKARDLKGDTYNVIAVIGDGSLSGGEAFEGLDYAATLGTNFIVVVNDNDMAIAPNHGGLYADLRMLRNTHGEAENNYFRSLGFDYVFVADGNDIDALVDTFRRIKDIDHPVVVHVVTDKGHGFAPAEADKEDWHWQMPYDIATGEVFSDEHPVTTYADLTAQFFIDTLKRDKRLVVVNAATPGVLGLTPEHRKQLGRHFVDVGIAEEQAAAMSSGLAKAGMRPVWGVMSTFVQRAYDQISQDIAINNNPAVIVVFGGGVRSLTDVTHLCWFDIPLLSNIPNVAMLTPAGQNDYLDMLKWAVGQTDHPVVIRVPGGLPADAPDEVMGGYDDLNTFRVVREGKDVAIIAAGSTLGMALEAADTLAAEGISPTVISPRFVSGLDEEMLSSLTPDHRAVVTVEDGCLAGGFGQKVSAFYGDTPMLTANIGLPREFKDRYNAADLARECRLTPEGIAETVRTLI